MAAGLGSVQFQSNCTAESEQLLSTSKVKCKNKQKGNKKRNQRSTKRAAVHQISAAARAKSPRPERPFLQATAHKKPAPALFQFRPKSGLVSKWLKTGLENRTVGCPVPLAGNQQVTWSNL
ncbi:hypothetical protein TIFTF001_039309 [Ficus carica]|uniref:Uncharacterized protein n=1 Tax=Ficus carica TaxID=3494 RepID=A0AA88JDS4_FICCA|nr:hypothetical protein TIFTF001_039309 [Ficus carica]